MAKAKSARDRDRGKVRKRAKRRDMSANEAKRQVRVQKRSEESMDVLSRVVGQSRKIACRRSCRWHWIGGFRLWGWGGCGVI